MSSLRSISGNRSVQPNMASASSIPQKDRLDPNAFCKKCKHRHRNKDCFRLQPELAPSSYKGFKNHMEERGKGAAVLELDSDTDTEGAIIAATSRANKIRTINDTGASHHFVPSKTSFTMIKTCAKPFNFDQAVGASSLNSQGTAILNMGKLSIKLRDALYSPSSMCNIVSAGRLERISSIMPDYTRSLLVLKNSEGHTTPIARLARENDVFYIHPLQNNNVSQIAAPGVARVPSTNSAQRWHQRLGHTGQTGLKKTAENSSGLEGIDLNNLTTCETCHLSKAQRYVSREPRLTPNAPLDEINIDTVGKITTSINGLQYVVIITDSKSRMRWAIMSSTKDQIAPLLVQWIETTQHQFNKKIRAIFKDGGTEFLRIKPHCEKHGLRTDVSAPDTPEQNGISESSNKVILQRARSMLIDAGMPAIYWPWAVEHACYINNRLYCLRTKKTPIVDFMQGLDQPYPDKIDFSHLPRFGCRAYKLISPRPG